MTARSSSRWLNLAFLGISALASAACTGLSAPGESRTDEQAPPSAPLVQPASASAPAPTPAPAPAPARTPGVMPSLADVAERAVPSVVNISATHRGAVAGRQNPLLDDLDLRDFFGRRGMPGLPEDRETRALGSGVIVASDGVVLTSAHVVQGADQVEITLHDGREVAGKVVGADPRSDLAVVRIQGKVDDLVAIPLGDSTALRMGDVVLAIGNPFGVGQTVTMGIVSATGRSSMGIVDYEDFIQTDAAINPGNSGGALVNVDGQLVGINTAILSRTGGSMGIGFAIPTAMAQPIMKSLLDTGKVVRGFLGVSVQDLDRDLAEALHQGQREGIVVADVVPDSPAAGAGVARGDIIRALNGKPVRSSSRFRNDVAAIAPGTSARLEIVRNGKPMTLDVRLGTLEAEKLPGRAEPGGGEPRSAEPSAEGLLGGLRAADLDGRLRRRLDVPSRIRGPVVTEVERGSPAARLGLRPGDIILEVDRRAVTTAAELRRQTRDLRGNVAILVYRDGATIYLATRGDGTPPPASRPAPDGEGGPTN